MARRVRRHDWTATKLGPVEEWSPSLRDAIDVILPVGFPMVVLWGPELIQIYNDGYCMLMGNKHPTGLGQPTRDCWPEVWHINKPIYEQVRKGETLTFEDSLYPITRSGKLEDAWFTLTYSPLRDHGEVIAGVLVTVFEKTDEVRHQRALVDREARYRAFVNASADVVYRMSPDWSEMRALDGRGFVADTTEPDKDWRDTYLVPDDRGWVQEVIDQAIAGKAPFALEHRVIRTDATIGWTASRAVPMLDEHGDIVEWFGTASDVTDRRRAEAELRESEALRRVALAGGRMGSWRWDLGKRLIWGDAQFLALWGFPPTDDPLPLSGFTGRMTPAGAAEMKAIVSRAIEAGEEFDGPLEIVSGPTAGRWIRWRGHVASDDTNLLFGVTFDVTEQKQAETRLRESEERQAFLLKLSDALRRLTDPREIQCVASRLLGETLAADRSSYFELAEDGDTLITGISGNDGRTRPSLTRLSQFGEPLSRLLARGQTVVVDDARSNMLLKPELAERLSSAGLGAIIAVPLLNGGQLVAILVVQQSAARSWSGNEVILVKEVAERTWAAVDLIRAEARLRSSEARQRALIEGMPQLVWRAVEEGEWTWASTQWTEFTGQRERDSHGHGWLDPVHPDDRPLVRDVWKDAEKRGGFEADYRIRHAREGRYRWFQSRASPVRDAAGTVVEWLGTSTDVEDLRGLRDRQQVLMAELQHRVRNILAIIRSIVRRSLDGEQSLRDYAQHLEGRLTALARTQVLLTRKVGRDVDLEDLIRDELVAQAADEKRIDVVGVSVDVSPKAAEVLTLAIHELATNALKYGAIGQPDARLRIDWSLDHREDAQWLTIRWTETGVVLAAPAQRRIGFGTELITRRVPYELNGTGSVDIKPTGLVCTITFPLTDRASILESGSAHTFTGDPS